MDYTKIDCCTEIAHAVVAGGCGKSVSPGYGAAFILNDLRNVICKIDIHNYTVNLICFNFVNYRFEVVGFDNLNMLDPKLIENIIACIKSRVTTGI